ncbi:SMI1/KNR4 family protein [Bacillus atrophaeus]|uniref:SMI1/KNR4 family protein n=1 Tax=Bacillus atrophaeus TaxID=1452 RepID=UPI0022826447|nr:SMI1/KNR4 family protein [Bacillus atrophaeus]MCY8464365.1 SMI1/KNR4 family protein [Bacillus atrophaeus]MCY8475818.1 SMI1/KNR4 family protein [Bacillus atrophaeus]MCY8837727.1 SMI1/KNR4 family protein [Bacillus atrophaeus]MCY8959990.1 SMI1/KNR4 family protein [Bacillus atrophaeus]MCY8963697.1 SMI1/KNR4 family protein [Bacillus atrophaeus]
MSFKKIEQKLKEFSIDTKTNPRIDTNEQINEIEVNLGNQLPSDYKDFLKAYGGCYLESKKTSDEIEYDVCYKPLEKDPWMDEDDETQLLEGFYGLTSNHDSIQKAIDTYSDRFPRNIIPIASSAGGNEICIDIENEKILFWDHELSHPDKDFFLIANSFEEFILSLVDEPIETDDNVSDVEIEILDNDFGKLLFGKED